MPPENAGPNGPKPENANAWAGIAGLGLTMFLFVSTSLMPMGLLPDIAAGLGRTEAFTGLLVTGYAWVTAALTLPLAVLLARIDRRRLLLGALALFVFSHGLAALATDFITLMVSRVLTAAAHAVLWAIASPTAVRLAPEGLGSKALAVVAAGVSLSTVLGVPLGTRLGQALGWRATFLAAGLAGLSLIGLLAALLPKLPADNHRPLKNLARIAGRPAVWRLYLVLALTLGGHAAAFTYLAPFLRLTGGWDPPAVVNFIWLFGTAGIAGGFLASLFTGRWSAPASLLALAVITAGLILANQAVALPIGAILICAAWGAALSGFTVLFQFQLFQAAPEATELAMSIYAVFFNLGIGGGAALGGHLFHHFDITAVPFGGAALTGLALLIFGATRKCGSRPTDD